jgi:hypothetical protein
MNGLWSRLTELFFEATSEPYLRAQSPSQRWNLEDDYDYDYEDDYEAAATRLLAPRFQLLAPNRG